MYFHLLNTDKVKYIHLISVMVQLYFILHHETLHATLLKYHSKRIIIKYEIRIAVDKNAEV